MSLPNIQYDVRVTGRDVIDFAGLNRSDAAVPGELTESLNLSTARYPLLCPRGKRTKNADYCGIADMYAYGDTLFLVTGNPTAYCLLSASISANTETRLRYGTTDIVFTPESTIVSGSELFIFGSMDRVGVWTVGAWAETYDATHSPTPAEDAPAALTMSAWNSVSSTVRVGGKLMSGDDEICDVDVGKKSWAVVSNRLCIMPDKLIIDMSGDEWTVQSMEADAGFANATSLAVTENSISAPISSKTVSGQAYNTNGYPNGYWYEYEGEWVQHPPENWCMYTYGKSKAAVIDCWDSANNSWDLDALAALGETKSGFLRGTAQYGVDKLVEVGDVFIVRTGTIQPVVANALNQEAPNPDKSLYNTAGIFGVVTSIVVHETWYSTTLYITTSCTLDIYEAHTGAPALYELFSAGDTVAVTGTPAGMGDTEAVTIRGVDEATNTLSFDDNSFRVVTAFTTLTEVMSVGNHRLRYDGNDYVFSNTSIIEAGTTLYVVSGTAKVFLFRDGDVIGEYAATVSDTASSDPPEAVTLTGYAASLTSMHVQRSVPELDFICESGNRLWGVNNEENVIRASALGDPKNFNTFDGVATDSYSVAVGSEGDFTGIIAFNGGVCCWKEHKLHKVLGGYPAEYYTAEYTIDGVASSCERSLTVINETLYYGGAHGIYAYTGGTPRRIGERVVPAPNYALYGAVGGTDGRMWYLSGVRWDNEPEMLVYDPVTGLWIREDDTRVVAFVYGEYHIRFLDTGGDVWAVNPTEHDNTLAWTAEFAPIDETWGAGKGRLPVVRKYYVRLDLRLDMAAGSTVKVEVKEDKGEWRTVHASDTTADVAKRVAILPRRCDRFQIRISGTGYVALRAMTREFTTGSERV